MDGAEDCLYESDVTHTKLRYYISVCGSNIPRFLPLVDVQQVPGYEPFSQQKYIVSAKDGENVPIPRSRVVMHVAKVVEQFVQRVSAYPPVITATT